MADALSVFYLGLRSAEPNHSRSSALVDQLPFDPRERTTNKRHLDNLCQKKNTAEYEEELLKEADAEQGIQQTERFRRWARTKLP